MSYRRYNLAKNSCLCIMQESPDGGMADAEDLKSFAGLRRVGSSPTQGIMPGWRNGRRAGFRFLCLADVRVRIPYPVFH